MTKLWPSTLSREEFARLLGVEPSRLKEWTSRRVIVPVEHERGRAGARYARQDLGVGVAIVELQRQLGLNSEVPFQVAQELAPLLRGLYAWNARPPKDGEPLRVIVVAEVSPAPFADVAEKLDELAAA